MLIDEILIEIGEFGPYQIMLYILLGLVGVPTAWQNMAVTFYGGQMDHWCHLPQLSSLPYEQQKKIAVPTESADTFSKCEVYDLPYDNYTMDDFINWNRTEMIPEGTPLKKCPDGWVYDKSVFTSSLVSQFDLVCDNASKVSLTQTIYMLGFLTGCIVFGQISDKIGRYKALIIALVMEVVLSTAVTFVPNYAAYVTIRFFVGSAAAGGFTTIFVMCMEIIGPTHRLATGLMVQGWFALGFMTIPGISYAIRDHGKLQLVCGISPIILWAVFGLADESPRWLATEGHDERAVKVLRNIARVNGRTLPDDLHLEDNRKKGSSDRDPSFVDLFKTKGLRKVTLNMWFDWFVTSMVYYGLSLGVDMLPGSIFLNSFLSAVIEIPAYVVTIFALQYLGRKWPNCITLVAGGICCLLCMPFIQKENLQQGATAFLLMGKFFTSATFAIVYVYSAELFPTVIRQVGVGSSSMCARVGSLIQPQIQRLENLWSPGTFLVYGVLSIIGGFLTLLLPETLGRKLPDTVEEGEAFASNVEFTLKMTIPKQPDKSTHKVGHENGTSNLGFVMDDKDSNWSFAKYRTLENTENTPRKERYDGDSNHTVTKQDDNTVESSRL